MQLQQVDIDALRHQLERIQKEREVENRMLANTVASLEDKVGTRGLMSRFDMFSCSVKR